MGAAGSSALDRLDARDREHVERLEGTEREIVLSTLLRHRRAEGLRVGDPLPDLVVHRLDGGDTVRLGELPRGRPLVLVFGSFT